MRLFNVQAPSEGIRTGERFDGDALFVSVLFRVGFGPRQASPLAGPGTVTVSQGWIKWAAPNSSPKTGFGLRAVHGRARLEGGVALDVTGREPGGRPLEVLGTILNPEFFPAELAGGSAALGVSRPFDTQRGLQHP